MPVIALPGAPDQALAIWWTLVLPVLDRLSGRSRRETVTLPLARKIASGVGIAEVALLERTDGAWMPLAVGDLPLATVARARCMAVWFPTAAKAMLRERPSTPICCGNER